jgi:hypothetical protein
VEGAVTSELVSVSNSLLAGKIPEISGIMAQTPPFFSATQLLNYHIIQVENFYHVVECDEFLRNCGQDIDGLWLR